MKLTSKLGVSVAALAAILTTAAIAQETGSQAPGRTMRNQNAMPGNMMGGDTSGMQGMMPMMQMMQQMGPMMEQCTETMAAMTEQMKSSPKGQDDNG